jgi:hypothetical protein
LTPIVGIVTELGRSQDQELEDTFKKLIQYWGTPDEGSSTTMVAALDPALNCEQSVLTEIVLKSWKIWRTDSCSVDVKGLYLKDCQIEDPAPHASDPQLAERLWRLSEELVEQKFELD